MYGATNWKKIVPKAIGKLQVPNNIIEGYMDVDCYYRPHFTSTLMSDISVLEASKHRGQYSSAWLRKFFDQDEDQIEEDIEKFGDLDLSNTIYQLESGSCMLVAPHCSTAL